MTDTPTVFPDVSTPETPKLEFVFEIELEFTRTDHIEDMPSGAGRGAVYLDSGTIRGPKLQGRAVPNSGGDYALFRPDGVLAIDARYVLESHDGVTILIHNKGYIWGREADTMARFRAWVLEGGPPVPPEEYYFRLFPSFEAPKGPYEWLTRHAIIGIGRRKDGGNITRYYAVT